jgi:hypothetical protein
VAAWAGAVTITTPSVANTPEVSPKASHFDSISTTKT